MGRYECTELNDERLPISLTRAEIVQISNSLNWACENLDTYNEVLNLNCPNYDAILHRASHLFGTMAEEIVNGVS